MQDFIIKNETLKQRVSFFIVIIRLKYEFFIQKTKKAFEIRTFFVSTNVDDYGRGKGTRTHDLSHVKRAL